MDHLQHDPRTKSQIKELLYNFLYEPTNRAFKKRLDELIVKNTLLSGYSHKSFMYKNVFYTCDLDAPPRKMNRLILQLQNPMNEYLKDERQLNEKELPYVMGYINQVLNSSNDLQDYLRLFPSSVHQPIQALIDSCPCRTNKLPEETVTLLTEKNLPYINMMKARMVTNLLI